MWDKLRNFLTPLYGDIDETCRADSQIFMDTLNNVSVAKDFVKKLPINLQAKYNVLHVFTLLCFCLSTIYFFKNAASY